VELKPCRNNMSPQQQIQLGQKVVDQVYQQMPVLPDSSRVTQYVQALGQKLATQAPGYRWPYNFHVVNVADINAFALPGGSIFVNLGTIQAASNEAQLAAVMSHEISHVVLQHSVCNLEKENRVGVFAGLGQIASEIILGKSTLGALAQKGIGLTAGLSFLRMGRDAEQQADLEGVGILYDAGYDPRAMPQFFETIQAKYGKGGAQFLSDHPNPGNRTEYVGREISSFVAKAHYVTNSTDFKRLQQQVSGMRAYTSKEVESGVWKRKDPNQTVSTGVNQYDGSTAANTRVDTAPPQQWITFTGNGFSMQVPSTWRVAGDRNSAMIAPPGGITPSAAGKTGNLVYGVLTGVYSPDQEGETGGAFSALVNELTRENPGIEPGHINDIRIGSIAAQSVDTVNRSANGGGGEHDWIVGIPGNRGLRYFVFVAPEQDFSPMRPTFEHILNSIRFE
jgi:beta-barrel assembly-enhancing protease